MMLNDPVVKNAIGLDTVHRLELPAEVVGAVVVVAIAFLIRRNRAGEAAA